MRGSKALVGVVVAALSLIHHGAIAQDQLKLAVGARGVGETFVPELGQNAGIFKKHGLALDIFYTQGGGETIQVVISNAAHIGVAIGFLGTIGAFAKGAPVRVIGSTFTGGNQLFWYVRADSPIKSLKDAAGKTVAYSTNGSSTHTSVLALKKFTGADFVPTQTGAAPGTYTQVMSGQIDVGWSVPPFVLQHLAEGRLQIIARGSDVAAIRDQTIRVNVANADALRQKRDAFVRYMRALSRAIDWAYSGDAAIDAYAAYAKVPAALAQRTRDEFYPKASLQLTEVRGLELTLKQALEYKYITSPLSVADVRAGLIDIVYSPGK